MAFFRNRSVNWLNLHYGIHATVIAGGGAFYTVYLLKAGVSLPAVLAAMAAILLGRFVIRPAVIPLAVRFGLRPMLIAGTLIEALQYPVLPLVHGVGPMLALVCALSSLGDTIYWSCYHAFFAALGDVVQVGGRQRGIHAIQAEQARAHRGGTFASLDGFQLAGRKPHAGIGAEAHRIIPWARSAAQRRLPRQRPLQQLAEAKQVGLRHAPIQGLQQSAGIQPGIRWLWFSFHRKHLPVG